MTTKENFIAEIEKLLETNTINDEAMDYFTKFKEGTVKNSSVITEKGATVLGFIQKQPADYVFTSKMVAEALDLNSRSVSGTLKKLISDGYVEKVTTISPITYQITIAGQEFNLNDFINK